jgi:hypothetical protein
MTMARKLAVPIAPSPVAVFGWPTYPLGLNLHTWAVTACGGTSIGDKGTLAAAATLAAVGYERAANGDRAKGGGRMGIASFWGCAAAAGAVAISVEARLLLGERGPSL